MKRNYQEVIDAMSNGEYTAEEIKSRIRSYLNNPALVLRQEKGLIK